MDTETIHRCCVAARDALAPWLEYPLAVHVAAHGIQPIALGEPDCHLVAYFSESLRHLPRAGPGQSVPQLSEEQIQRAATVAAVAVERVLADQWSVRGHAQDAVGRDDESDHEVFVHADKVSATDGTEEVSK